MNTALAKMEKFFFLLLILNPLVDLAGGVYLRILTAELEYGEKLDSIVTPSLIIRMAVLLLFAAYVLMLRDRKIILTILPIGVAWLFTVAGEFLFAAEFSLLSDMQYIAKFVYNLAVLLVYWRVFQRSGLDREALFKKLNWVVSYTLLILSSMIVLSNILGIGYTTYEDRWGYRGTRGFFFSGNDLTAVLMVLIPLAVAFYLLLDDSGFKRRQKLFWLFPPAATFASLLVIGTKTSLLALLLVLIVFYVYCFSHRHPDGSRRLLKRMNRLSLTFVLIFVLMIALSQAAVLLDIQLSLFKFLEIYGDLGLLESLTSGRILKLQEAFEQYQAGGVYAWLFGIGRGTQEHIIEMDLAECWIYYGLIGLPLMVWLYLKLGIGFVIKYFRNKDLTGLALFLSLGMTAGYLLIAGHVLFSVTSGFYFSLVLLYSHLYYAEHPARLELLPSFLGRRSRDGE